MNYLVLAYVLGVVCLFEAAFMLVPLITALIYKEGSIAVVYLLTTLICTTIGAVLVIISGRIRKIRAKEGMIAMALSWIVMSLLGALPFLFLGRFQSMLMRF